MTKNWKPKGYPSVSPYLITSDPKLVAAFLKKTFGARFLRRHTMPDGRVAHWEMQVADSVVMMGDAGDGSTVPCHIHVYVEDVDRIFRKAVKAGGEIVQEPLQKDDGDKRGGIEDPAGAAVWWISTQVGLPLKTAKKSRLQKTKSRR